MKYYFPRYRKRPSLVVYRTGYPPCLPEIATLSLAMTQWLRSRGKSILQPFLSIYHPYYPQTVFCLRLKIQILDYQVFISVHGVHGCTYEHYEVSPWSILSPHHKLTPPPLGGRGANPPASPSHPPCVLCVVQT
jgi:hypothetical protein